MARFAARCGSPKKKAPEGWGLVTTERRRDSMIVRNRLGIPEAFVLAVQRMWQGGGMGIGKAIRTTSLIGPPQATAVAAAHKDELEADVADMIPALIGNGVHRILEDVLPPFESEVALTAGIDGWRVTGTADHVADGVITDWKSCKMMKLQKSDTEAWEQQLNVYAYLAQEMKIPVRKLQVVALMIDWTEFAGKRAGMDSPVVTVPIPLWDSVTAKRWISSRLRELEDAFAGNPRPCTDEERWYTKSVYAVMKKGRKSAVKLCSTEEEARELAAKHPGGWVDHRGGTYKKCERWCKAAPWCKQWNSS